MYHRLRFVVVLTVLGAGIWLLSDRITRLAEVEDLSTKVEQFQKQISAPAPLRSSQNSPSAFLTRAGVIIWTNNARQDNSLPLVKENTRLNAAARVKVQDMFARQYFAHVSPLGLSAADLATREGYEFIAIGENLALGNFENDKALVQAWMDSPGHRENILGENFTEIGVAVAEGIFEGESTWLGVQIFARPRSDCPMVDDFLKQRIEINESGLETMLSDLERQRLELDATRPKSGEEYNAKVTQYNSDVQAYNVLLKVTKDLIAQYNDQVNAFNICLNR